MGDHAPYQEQVYAVIRLDGPFDSDTDMELRITVKEVVRTLESARAEVERLNRLNGDKDCRYFWQMTRLFNTGESFGTHPEGQTDTQLPS